jgi:anti-sigma factor RsiW
MSEPPPKNTDAADAAGADAEAEKIDEIEEIDEAIIAKVSDYLDGVLPAAERAEVARQIASDVAWKRAHVELTETRTFLSGLRKAHAPPDFAKDVAETIHQRSAGRFFGRRTFGDRVPFGALLVVALGVLAVVGYLMWSSSTGSLKVDRTPAPQPQGSAVDRP